jgi:hypothetical protein
MRVQTPMQLVDELHQFAQNQPNNETEMPSTKEMMEALRSMTAVATNPNLKTRSDKISALAKIVLKYLL